MKAEDYKLELARTMSEAEFQRKVIQLAKQLGWEWYHTRYSIGSRSGFPDLVLWRPPDRLIFAELKRAGGKLTNRQAYIVTSLYDAGQDVYVWTPEHWDAIHEVLR